MTLPSSLRVVSYLQMTASERALPSFLLSHFNFIQFYTCRSKLEQNCSGTSLLFRYAIYDWFYYCTECSLFFMMGQYLTIYATLRQCAHLKPFKRLFFMFVSRFNCPEACIFTTLSYERAVFFPALLYGPAMVALLNSEIFKEKKPQPTCRCGKLSYELVMSDSGAVSTVTSHS